jgi:hypothetical protein
MIGESGFVPTDLTINRGDTVTFTNTGTTNHWPASDIHPSHEIYPEFDPRRSLLPGESWSFTFTKPGLWRMHDHDMPIFVGSITVIDPETGESPGGQTSAPHGDTLFTECPADSTDFYCFERYYQGLVAREGVPRAVAELKLQYETNEFIRAQCHPLTHVIGRAATLLYPDVAEAYTHGDEFCWSGYYHGVMEGIIAKLGRAEIESRIPTLCNGIESKSTYGFDYYNCVHGLGHGLMALTNNELFDTLELCDRLEGSWERESCYGGVFMENVIVDNKNHFTKYLKPEDPVYPCTAVEARHKNACYLMQTSYMLKVSGGDFTPLFSLCRSVDAGYEATCFQSLGRDASGSTVSDLDRTTAICQMGSAEFEVTNCLIGAVKDFISYHHTDSQARALCEKFDGAVRDTCLSTATSYYATF